MLAHVTTFAIDGIEPRRVTVEVDVRQGLPAFSIVGLGDRSVREARERVRGAIANSGFVFPQGVAVVAQALIPDLGWAAAFTLGAIVSPPDAIAATAVAQRLGVPRRLVTIIEGESLLMGINDIAVSSGSACTSATLEPSYVLKALGAGDDLAHNSANHTSFANSLKKC